ncbi:thiamine pyrophosphate-binding protein [Pseudarthrobacter sp. MDT3-26]|uniref:thiamine pyrophosphate-binding protein n=1 Tax=Pseudarthrobacter raffinosi TaxID=2953651 RepID=UPI00208F7FA8|nr:thiamine pyrophosphate-binding protein [Pseudarthrobacter sp. MDT3-26]MCO4262514.1 thiamine pyrophosphate-binding protein [Pseudarthrobacter sp. MDT3-26]
MTTSTPVGHRLAVPGELILDELAACQITHVVTVPDFVQMSVHAKLRENYLPDVEVIHTSTEDEAVVIAAGLYLGGANPVVIIQNQGLYACVNNLRAIGLDCGLPIFMMIGQFGREEENFGQDPALSDRRVVRLLEPLLDTLEIPHLSLEGPEDIGNVRRAYELSRERSWPTALVIGVPTAWT